MFFLAEMRRVTGFWGIRSGCARLRLAELLGEHGVLECFFFLAEMRRVIGFWGIRSGCARLRLAELLGEHGVLERFFFSG